MYGGILGMLGGGAAGAGGMLGGMGGAAAGGAGGMLGGMGGAGGILGMLGGMGGGAKGGGSGMLSPELLELLKSPEFKGMIDSMGEMGQDKQPIQFPQLMPPAGAGMGMNAMQGMFRPYSFAPQGMSFGGY